MTRITVNLTTDGINPNGQHQFIEVDSDHYHLFNDQTLCRYNESRRHLTVVRDHQGYYVRRIGKEINGITLSSYIYGKLYMRRVSEDQDPMDFTPGAFKADVGFPCAYKCYTKPDGVRASNVMHLEEMSQDPRGINMLMSLYRNGMVCAKTIKHIEKPARRQASDKVVPIASRKGTKVVAGKGSKDVTLQVGKVKVHCSVDDAIKMLRATL